MSEKILRGVFSTKYENFPIFSSFNINIFLQYTSVLGCVWGGVWGRVWGVCWGVWGVCGLWGRETIAHRFIIRIPW